MSLFSLFLYDHLSENEHELANFVDIDFVADFPSTEYTTNFQVITISYLD